MKKTCYIVVSTLILSVALFYLISCERTEIKPEQHEVPDPVLYTSPTERLVGTWVRYWDSDRYDTLRFSNDGTFVYSLGGYLSNGNLYTEDYYYECTENYLINSNNPYDFIHEIHFLEFNEDNTVVKLHNFTFLPVDVSVVYSVTFKKID